jgi:hypothetical protein
MAVPGIDDHRQFEVSGPPQRPQRSNADIKHNP